MFQIIVKKEFRASHNIKYCDGKIDKKHWHKWIVEAYVGSQLLTEEGLVMDFKILEEELEDLLRPFVGKYLNEVYPFNKMNPTAENFAKWLYDNLRERVKEPIEVKKIIIYEGEKYAAAYESL